MKLSILWNPIKRNRKIGFQYPYDTLQILAWIAYFLLQFEFILFTLPALPYYIMIPSGAIFILLSGTWYVLNFLLGVINPRDPESLKQVSYEDIGCGESYCMSCKASVDSESKHCKLCNKCVLCFDHHCRWLNTCVGKRNYKYFFMFLTITPISILFSVVLKLYCIVSFSVEYETFGNRVQAIYTTYFPHYILFAFQMVASLLQIIATIPIFQLWFLHVKLILRQQTTYAYIVETRRIKAEKVRAKAEKREPSIVYTSTFNLVKNRIQRKLHVHASSKQNKQSKDPRPEPSLQQQQHDADSTTSSQTKTSGENSKKISIEVNNHSTVSLTSPSNIKTEVMFSPSSSSQQLGDSGFFSSHEARVDVSIQPTTN
mmetsp:Transcript_4908/g.7272  ORF Transcript_4908/g.7272 Transcript_4908/m.7272 type:complete len:372 (+) Transcript_4908:182-1297(+)